VLLVALSLLPGDVAAAAAASAGDPSADPATAPGGSSRLQLES